MSATTLFLFPDTNLFVQCRALEELDWTIWGPFDEIHLIVCRAVQSEIDNQKNKGSDRLGKKARTASSLFREIILSGKPDKDVRQSRPVVKLSIRPDFKPSAEISERLQYGERDDQLVGTAYGFRQAHPNADVRVLTHDTGPMASAKMVGLAVAAIPDDWLLPPESTEGEKKLASMERELSRLKKAEPEFKILCVNDKNEQLDRLDIEVAQYEPLSPSAVEDFMAQLSQRFPLATDFGPRERVERDARSMTAAFLGEKEVFKPATDEQIAAYQDDEYPKWLDRCEKFLLGLHTVLQRRAGPPRFRFVARNVGSRPARDALVTVEAKGDFEIRPPPYKSEREREAEEARNLLELPPPPKEPHGVWEKQRGFYRSLSEELATRRVAGLMGPGTDLFPIHSLTAPIARRDPNGFFYKPDRSRIPTSQFSLECEQWRHEVSPEVFAGEFHYDTEEETIAGMLECRIHAENLSTPASLKVPVRLTIKRIDLIGTARSIVDIACRTVADILSERLQPLRKADEELARVYELEALIETPRPPDAYFRDFRNSLIQSPQKKKQFLDIERDLQRLDLASWEVLKSEAKLLLTARDAVRGWQALFDILNHAKAYNHLKKLGCTEIAFVPRATRQQTPDLKAVIDGKKLLCEVKTINPSDDEALRRQTASVGTIRDRLESGFFNKLASDLARAKAQMLAYDAEATTRKVVYVIVNFDDHLHEYADRYQTQIDEYLAANPVPELEVVFSIKPPFYGAMS
ncbi:MAG: PIN domain-containing protein [Xanthobacteraceae bacterium]